MCGCFFYDLAFLVKLSLVFLPTFECLCKRAGAGQWLIFSVSLGANALLQPHGVTGPEIWAASGASPILGSLCSTDSGGKGPCRTGLHSDSSVHDVMFINMDRSPVLCTVRTCSQAPRAHSLLGRKGGPGQRSSEEVSCGLVLPAVTLGMFCFLTGPLTFQEDIGSESFQEVLLLL